MKTKNMIVHWRAAAAGLILSLIFAGSALGSKTQVAPGLEVTLQSDFEYAAEKDNLRDPFKTYVERPETAGASPVFFGQQEPEIKPPDLKIQGIFWGGAFPQAIVNDKVVKVNDQLEGGIISRISKDGITLKIGYKEFIYNAPGRSSGGSKNNTLP